MPHIIISYLISITVITDASNKWQATKKTELDKPLGKKCLACFVIIGGRLNGASSDVFAENSIVAPLNKRHRRLKIFITGLRTRFWKHTKTNGEIHQQAVKQIKPPRIDILYLMANNESITPSISFNVLYLLNQLLESVYIFLTTTTKQIETIQ